MERGGPGGRALAIVLLVCAIDGADLAVLGAAFKIFEERLGMSPATLGKVAMVQAIAQSVMAPVWGWMCDTGFASRRALWTAGVLGWSAAMAALSAASTLWVILLVRLVNGVFLACLSPLTQSWVAEAVPMAQSGRLFGILGAAGAIGGAASTMLLTSYGGEVFALGGLFGAVSGWRLLCACISLLSLGVAAASWLTLGGGEPPEAQWQRQRPKLPDDPHQIEVLQDRPKPGLVDAAGEIAANLREHWKSYTFRVILFQGVTGGVPWSALAFKLMYFRYIGMSSQQINVLTAAEVIPRILGGLIGGFVGDFAAKASPQHGRALTGQFAVGCGIPLMLAQIVLLPQTVGTVLWPYVVCNTLFCLVAGWTPAGVIRPLFLAVVDKKCRASILAWEHALEGACAALLGAPLVGFLAENAFQYHTTQSSVSAMPPELRQHNIVALRWSLVIMTTFPWVLCFAAISCLHWSYKYDVVAGDVEGEATALCRKRPGDGVPCKYGGVGKTG